MTSAGRAAQVRELLAVQNQQARRLGELETTVMALQGCAENDALRIAARDALIAEMMAEFTAQGDYRAVDKFEQRIKELE